MLKINTVQLKSEHFSASSPPAPEYFENKCRGRAAKSERTGWPRVVVRHLEFVFSWSGIFPAEGIGEGSLTHRLHELLVVLISVDFPGAVECHGCGCGCGRAALQERVPAQGIYALPYLQSNLQDDVAE